MIPTPRSQRLPPSWPATPPSTNSTNKPPTPWPRAQHPRLRHTLSPVATFLPLNASAQRPQRHVRPTTKAPPPRALRADQSTTKINLSTAPTPINTHTTHDRSPIHHNHA